jgi:hypothetical protein
MKRRKQLNPPLRHYAPPVVTAMPLAASDASDTKVSWMLRITQKVLDTLRWGPAPKPSPPPQPDADPRLVRIGIRQIAASDPGPRGDRHTGASTWLPPK